MAWWYCLSFIWRLKTRTLVRQKTPTTTGWTQIAQKAHKEGTTLKAMAVKLGYVTEKNFDEWVRPENMVGEI